MQLFGTDTSVSQTSFALPGSPRVFSLCAPCVRLLPAPPAPLGMFRAHSSAGINGLDGGIKNSKASHSCLVYEEWKLLLAQLPPLLWAWGSGWGGINTWDQPTVNQTPLFLLLVAKLHCLGERVNSDPYFSLKSILPSLAF